MSTVLRRNRAEARGFAIAAAAVTRAVEARIEALIFAASFDRCGRREETRARCLRVERRLPEELFDELRAHATSTHGEAADLVGASFEAVKPSARGASSRWAEQARSPRGRRIAALAMHGDDGDVAELAAWALPVQKRHLETALDAIAPLSTTFDPVGPRWG